MSGFIENIKISNFKSIKSCEIKDCKRINLFIGRPNVGKSNILEALSLFSIPFLRENKSKELKNLVRLERVEELFYKGNIDQFATVETNLSFCQLDYRPKLGLWCLLNFENDHSTRFRIDENLRLSSRPKVEGGIIIKGSFGAECFNPPIKKYLYKHNVVYKKGHARYLIPPYGDNLFSIIDGYTDLKHEVYSLIREYGIDPTFDIGSGTIKILEKRNDSEILLIPYTSIADTLQRVIFYKAAIASNDDSILLFEEPEAHAFPPEMAQFTQEMIHKKDNQFFIATHSPFILNDLLENAREELAVFVVRYEDHETKTRQLTPQELHDVFQNGVDLFTNNESYL